MLVKRINMLQFYRKLQWVTQRNLNKYRHKYNLYNSDKNLPNRRFFPDVWKLWFLLWRLINSFHGGQTLCEMTLTDSHWIKQKIVSNIKQKWKSQNGSNKKTKHIKTLVYKTRALTEFWKSTDPLHRPVWGSPGKTVYMEKNHRTQWYLTRTVVRSHLDEMNSFSHERFVFRKWNSPFCWGLTQMRYPTQVGCLTSFKQPLNIPFEFIQ